MDIKKFFKKYNGEIYIPIKEDSDEFKDIINTSACYNADISYNEEILTIKVYNEEFFGRLLYDLILKSLSF